MKAQNSIEQKLTRARTQLLLNQPFFGALCLRLKLASGPVPTMATDGRRIAFNPVFVDGLKPAELEATLAHEVMHCALGHHCRRGERDPTLWNEAADLAINPILVGNGFTLPAGALIDPSFNDLSAEEIYARLLRDKNDRSGSWSNQTAQQAGNGGGGTSQNQQQPQNGQPPATSSNSETQRVSSQKIPALGQAQESSALEPRLGGFGEVLDATDDQGNPASQAEKSRQQHEWSIAADQAIRSAKACGNEPAQIERPLRESRESAQDWRTLLRDFIAATTPSDYRWSPPNRRYIASGLYLPSVDRSGVGEIVIAVDTSGSIGTRELEQFAAEISAISDEAKPEGIHVVYCDAAVQSVQEFRSSEPVRLDPKGGGGTDFLPPFEWVEQNGITPACLIYLTDLCCDSYPEPPQYPVLWVTDSRRIAPFAETIRICAD